MQVLRWLRAHGCPWWEGTCNAAAESGHLETLQWVRRRLPLLLAPSRESVKP